MEITRNTPPPDLQRKQWESKYSDLFNAVVECDGNWVSVALEDIAGTNQNMKRTRLYCVARRRNVKINTAVRSGRMYVRLAASKAPCLSNFAPRLSDFAIARPHKG